MCTAYIGNYQEKNNQVPIVSFQTSSLRKMFQKRHGVLFLKKIIWNYVSKRYFLISVCSKNISQTQTERFSHSSCEQIKTKSFLNVTNFLGKFGFQLDVQSFRKWTNTVSIFFTCFRLNKRSRNSEQMFYKNCRQFVSESWSQTGDLSYIKRLLCLLCYKHCQANQWILVKFY